MKHIVYILFLLGILSCSEDFKPLQFTCIDTSNREEVVKLYKEAFNSVVPASNWKGNISSCQEGTTSAEFRAVMMKRINFIRAMNCIELLVEKDSIVNRAQQLVLLKD